MFYSFHVESKKGRETREGEREEERFLELGKYLKNVFIHKFVNHRFVAEWKIHIHSGEEFWNYFLKGGRQWREITLYIATL